MVEAVATSNTVTMNALSALKEVSVVVADTGNFSEIAKFSPEDATTNPSLILSAVNSGNYEDLIKQTVDQVRNSGPVVELAAAVADELAVAFGCKLLEAVPGVVSTEVDARLSFDVHSTVEKARAIISSYAARGIGKERVLVKIASTWEGCQAAKILEAEGIRCNLTLLFSFAQAVAAAEAGAYLISPFVGRILDWFKKNSPDSLSSDINEHPGVKSVRAIFNYYKKHGYKTIVMGASFRSVDEIIALAGCDRMTIAPKFLEQLANSNAPVERCLSSDRANELCTMDKIAMDEKTFRWMLNEDAMATEKLSEGIRAFHKDYERLLTCIREKYL